MDGGEDFHGLIEGIGSDEFLVDFEDPFEFAEDFFASDLFDDVAEVEVDHISPADAEAFLADLEDFAGGDVAGDEVTVLGVAFFEEVVAFVFGDVVGWSGVVGFSGHPDASPFAAGGFADESALVFAGDGGGMDLDELGIGVFSAGLEASGGGGAGADDAHGALAEDEAITAGGDDDGVGAEGVDLHGSHVLGDDACALSLMEDRPEEFPELEFVDESFGFPSSGLFVEGVEQLLAGGGAREEGSFEEGPAEESEGALAFGGSVEGDAHAVEEVDDFWGPVAHFEDRGLVGEEVAAEDGFVEVHPLAVPLLSGDFVAGVDAALGTDAMTAFDGDHGEEVDGHAFLGEFDGAGQTRQTAADDNDSFIAGHI